MVTTSKKISAEKSQPKEEKKKKILTPTDKEGIYKDANGNRYKVDHATKTMKKIASTMSEININDIALDKMPMTIYQRYLKDRYMGEPCVLKKDKLRFRDYVVSCSADTGFIIQDTHKKYEVVSDFDGIPTPKELGDWFDKPKREFTAEENRDAEERGKKASEEKEAMIEAAKEDNAEDEVDYEDYRKRVLSIISMIESGKRVCEDPIKEFKNFIPSNSWRRRSNKLLKQLLNREIRFKKFLRLMREMTEDIQFVKEEKHRFSFKGTLLPSFHKVGNLVGNMLEVDDKKVYAVPFLTEFALHFEPRIMPQLMKFTRKEISAVDFIKNPISDDWKEEYKKNVLENSAENANVLSCVMNAAGIMPPQSQLYSDDLKVGDRIYLFDPIRSEWVYKDITSVDKGVEINGGVGLYKNDTFIVVGHRDILKIPYNFSGVVNDKDTKAINEESIVILNNWYKRLEAFYPFNDLELNGNQREGVRLYFGRKDGDVYVIYGEPYKMINRIRKFLLQQGITKFEDLEKDCRGDRYELPK